MYIISLFFKPLSVVPFALIHLQEELLKSVETKQQEICRRTHQTQSHYCSTTWNPIPYMDLWGNACCVGAIVNERKETSTKSHHAIRVNIAVLHVIGLALVYRGLYPRGGFFMTY